MTILETMVEESDPRTLAIAKDSELLYFMGIIHTEDMSTSDVFELGRDLEGYVQSEYKVGIETAINALRITDLIIAEREKRRRVEA